MDENPRSTNGIRWTAWLATVCAVIALFYGKSILSVGLTAGLDAAYYAGAAIICAGLLTLGILGASQR